MPIQPRVGLFSSEKRPTLKSLFSILEKTLGSGFILFL
ncbi:hypothetical protein LEP1GSC185_0287 [Leptospira licerasiae serovar Varillal str. VAR 010]|uniref:Uncharacterized protein n=1 Tax=Leptospira licerasiae str. MMD4847 TaxID=1049971 RepID=A0ABN0H5V9_9LEPT|nr:hypothetical protein LEP1GSC185_0287 [Leptospira licerasiae serovar Varillal str. VAR 010]EJZ40953.1 hypothetical protein LEP1GSC178_1856 [Leptospira licerasiae str. MMD4847]